MGPMSAAASAQYSRRVAGESGEASPQADELRRLVPVIAFAAAIVAAVADPSWTADLVVAAVPVVAFALWAYRRDVPFAALSLAAVVPVDEQALHAERRRIARDVHDFVGHGLAAVMLQVTSARHVLCRDPDSAEEALRAAEVIGRHSNGRAASHRRAPAERGRDPHSSTMLGRRASQSSCERVVIYPGFPRPSAPRSTGSPRRRSRTRLGMRRTRERC
jgi:Histidine kinase